MKEDIYELVWGELKKDKYSGFLKWIYFDDNSIMFEDIVGDIVISILTNDMTIDDIGEEYLRQYRNSRRNHSHTLIDNIASEEMILQEEDYVDYSDYEEMKYIGLTEEDMLCTMYALNKDHYASKEIQKFVGRKSGRGKDYTKLCKRYENIISKFVQYIKINNMSD